MLYTELTKKALKICFDAHKDQVDKCGIPYVTHPLHLAEQMPDEITTVVALLHDVVEDSDYTLEDLKAAGFPPEVTDAVALLTHDESVPYLEYVAALKDNPVAKRVKLADLNHNCDLSRIEQISERDLQRVQKYRKAIKILEEKTMSRVNFGAKPIMFPQPVLIIATYDENGVPNAMNAAWGITTDFKEITISLGEHKTTDNLAVRKAFTVSMATENYVAACDYVGIESGRKVPDKFERAGFHATKSEFVDAPLIDELPMALECRVKSFEDGILIGEIVNVSADESVITDGRIDPKKLKPITFDPCNNAYLALGAKVGNAFRDGAQLK